MLLDGTNCSFLRLVDKLTIYVSPTWSRAMPRNETRESCSGRQNAQNEQREWKLASLPSQARKISPVYPSTTCTFGKCRQGNGIRNFSPANEHGTQNEGLPQEDSSRKSMSICSLLGVHVLTCSLKTFKTMFHNRLVHHLHQSLPNWTVHHSHFS